MQILFFTSKRSSANACIGNGSEIHMRGDVLLPRVGQHVAIAAVRAGMVKTFVDDSQGNEQVLGFSHAEAGAELARRWHFPQRLVDALAQQVAPLEAPQPEPLAALVHLAVWRACIHGSTGDADRLIHTYPDAVGLAMGLDHDVLVTEDVPPLRELEAS